jgi:hypothetical protein
MKKEVVNFLDILSPQANLFIFNQTRHKTLIGAFFGFFSIIAITACAFYFTVQTFQRKDATIIYNQNSLITYPLNISNIPLMTLLMDGSGNKMKNQNSTYTIKYTYLQYFTSYDATGKAVSNFTIDYLDTEPCNLDTSFGEYRKYFEGFNNMQESQCLPLNKYNLSLYGQKGNTNKGYSNIQIYVNTCVNDTYTKCLDPASIETALSNVKLSVQTIGYEINHQNYSNPFIETVMKFELGMSSTIFKRYSIFQKNIIYETDYGFLFEDKVTGIRFASDDYIDISVDLRKSSGSLPQFLPVRTVFGQGVFYLSSKTDFYFRSYTKLQDLMANIGGIVKGILLISQFITSSLTSKLNYKKLYETIFSNNNFIKKQQHLSQQDQLKNQNSKSINNVEEKTLNHSINNFLNQSAISNPQIWYHFK